MSKKHFNFKSSIRDWYIRAFPSDQLGYRINPLATFAGAVKCMADGGDIYKYLGVGDSPVRENVFFKIAAITGVDYDAVYDLWLHHDEDECSRLVFLGDHPDCAVDRDWREQFDEVVSPSEQVRYDELLAAEEHRKAETFDSFMEVNETPMDEVRGAGIAMMLMQGIVFAEIAKKIDGPSEIHVLRGICRIVWRPVVQCRRRVDRLELRRAPCRVLRGILQGVQEPRDHLGPW